VQRVSPAAEYGALAATKSVRNAAKSANRTKKRRAAFEIHSRISEAQETSSAVARMQIKKRAPCEAGVTFERYTYSSSSHLFYWGPQV